MRVLSVVRPLREIGGLEAIVSQIGAGLEFDSHDQTVLVYGRPPLGSPTASYFDERRRSVAVCSLHKAWGHLRAADVVHVHAATMTYWSLPLVLLSRFASPKTFLTIHLPSEPSRRPRLRGRAAARLEELVRALVLRVAGIQCFADGDAAARHAQQRWAGWVHVRGMLNGVPDPGYCPPVEGGPLRIAFVGRLAPHKDPSFFIEAVRRACDNGADLEVDVVGDGPLSDVVRAQVASAGLGHVVRLHGHLSKPLDVVGNSDVLVLVSRAEGCPVVVMEAAALGRPALVREGLEGLDEILPGCHISVAANAGVDEFAEAFVLLARDKHVLSDLAPRVRQRYEALFSDEAAKRRYQDAYGLKQALKPSKRRIGT